MGPRILASWTKTVLLAATRSGLDRAELLRASGIDPAVLEDPEGRILHVAHLALWDLIAGKTVDPWFGLHLGASADGAALSVVGHALATSLSVGDALNRLVRIRRLIQEGHSLCIVRSGDSVVVTDSPEPTDPPWPRHLAECRMATYLALPRRFSGVEFIPRGVHLQHQRPDDVREHERFFKCPIVFEHRNNELVIDARDLDLPFVAADVSLSEYLERRAHDLMGPLPTLDALLVRTRAAIAGALPDGAPTLASMAKAVGVSPRTLQRRLQEAGITFSAMVERVRHETALRLLAEPPLSISEVAFFLGFSTSSAFRRAFHRWEGTSPKEFRASRPRSTS
jgi:AraC-like DNA-binding protein